MAKGERRHHEASQAQACRELLVPGRPEGKGLVERLARCLGAELQRHALHRCGNAPDAEDAVQEAMATAIRYLVAFRGETSLRNWLLRLVSTACIHQRRGRRNDWRLHVPLDGEAVAPLLVDAGQPAEEALLAQEQLKKVVEVLGALHEEERSLLLRHEGEEVTLAQLAGETGQSVAALRTRLFRLRRRLRGQLEALMHGTADGPDEVRPRAGAELP